MSNVHISPLEGPWVSHPWSQVVCLEMSLRAGCSLALWPLVGRCVLFHSWFLISLSPAILEIITSPVKTKNQPKRRPKTKTQNQPNSSVLSVFPADVLEALWSLWAQFQCFNCAFCSGSTDRGVSNHHSPMNEQRDCAWRNWERETTQRGVGALGSGVGISFSLCTIHQAVLPCMISWKKYIFHLWGTPAVSAKCKLAGSLATLWGEAARKPECMLEEEFLMSVCLEEYKFFYSPPVA